MRLQTFLIMAICVLSGCASQHDIVPTSLVGKPLDVVVCENHLDRFHSWPTMNLPAGSDDGTTYFLERGDLVIRYSGDPAVVMKADFYPSNKSADARLQEANDGWADWIMAHTTKNTPT